MAVDPNDIPYRRDLPEVFLSRRPLHPAALGTVARTIGTAALAAAMLGSGPLRDWAFNLPLWLGPVRDLAFQAADTWNGLMAALGLTAVHPALREAFRAFQYLQ
jgi:hypothetical protein